MKSMIVAVFVAFAVSAVSAGVLAPAPLLASPLAAPLVSSPLLARSVVASPLSAGIVAPGLAAPLALSHSVVAPPVATVW